MAGFTPSVSGDFKPSKDVRAYFTAFCYLSGPYYLITRKVSLQQKNKKFQHRFSENTIKFPKDSIFSQKSSYEALFDIKINDFSELAFLDVTSFFRIIKGSGWSDFSLGN